MAKRVRKPKEPTKKQIAMSRRERQQQKWVLIGISGLILTVAVVFGLGLYHVFVAMPAEPVLKVNGVPVRLDDYQKRVLFERMIIDNYIANVQSQILQAEASGDESAEFMVSYMSQMLQQAQQERAGIDISVVDRMLEEELVRQKCAELGLSVSEDEVTQEIRNSVAVQQGFWTKEQATATTQARVQATATARNFTPTPTFTPSPTLTATTVITETPTPTAEPLTPEPTPTKHIITDEEYTKSYTDFMTAVSERTGMSEEEYRRLIEVDLLKDRLKEYFAENTPKSAEQVYARHILVDTEEEAEDVIARLKNGESFGELAREVSRDTGSAAKGGDLGWFARGAMVEPFEEAAFSLEVGQVSEPVQTQYGWHVIEILEKGVRELDEYALSQAQEQAYQDWLNEAKNGEGVEYLWTPDMSPPEEEG